MSVDQEREKGLRLFVAVPAPPPVRERASAVISSLRGLGEVRWVAPELLHLTLKFLGDTPGELVPQIAEILVENANDFSRIVVELGGIGAFPNLRKPQTLWMSVEGAGLGPLAGLAGRVDRSLEALGIPREGKAFRPHLTIGRVKGPRGLSELARGLKRAAEEQFSKIEWRVDEFCLVQSLLRPTGPEYTTLHRFPLGGAATERDGLHQ